MKDLRKSKLSIWIPEHAPRASFTRPDATPFCFCLGDFGLYILLRLVMYSFRVKPERLDRYKSPSRNYSHFHPGDHLLQEIRRKTSRIPAKGILRRFLVILGAVLSISPQLFAQGVPFLRDCDLHLYNSVSFIFLAERFGGEVARWVKADPGLRRTIQQNPGQDLTVAAYSAGLLEQVPGCVEPAVHVLAGNAVPSAGGATAPGTTGFTVVINGLPKLHCEAVNLAEQLGFRRGMFAVRFEPPGSTVWNLGMCGSNPIASILSLGCPLPQPNTAYLFFSVDLPFCDLTKLLASVKDPVQKAGLEDRYLRMAGVVSELSAYRDKFARQGVMTDSIDLFPTAYYYITSQELERIRNTEYQYPDAKLRQLIAFYDAYKRNREAHDRGDPVEAHWQRHFDKVEEEQKSLSNCPSLRLPLHSSPNRFGIFSPAVKVRR